MIEKVVFLASGFYQGKVGEVLQMWEDAGFFAYILPFLLIFALVFLLVSRIKAFEDNKSISGVIAAVVALMALQSDMVSQFFSEIFPRFGIGLAVLLVVIILLGVFIDPEQSSIGWVLLAISGIIALIVLYKTAGAVGWASTDWWTENWELVASVVFILLLVGVIMGAGSGSKGRNKYKPLLFFDHNK